MLQRGARRSTRGIDRQNYAALATHETTEHTAQICPAEYAAQREQASKTRRLQREQDKHAQDITRLSRAAAATARQQLARSRRSPTHQTESRLANTAARAQARGTQDPGPRGYGCFNNGRYRYSRTCTGSGNPGSRIQRLRLLQQWQIQIQPHVHRLGAPSVRQIQPHTGPR